MISHFNAIRIFKSNAESSCVTSFVQYSEPPFKKFKENLASLHKYVNININYQKHFQYKLADLFLNEVHVVVILIYLIYLEIQLDKDAG